MFSTFDTSVSGLTAERVRLNIIANNIANMHSTRNEYGEREAYSRRLPVFQPGNPGSFNEMLGVHVTDIVESGESPRLVFEPGHPDAIQDSDFYKTGTNGQITNNPLDEYADMQPLDLAQLAAEKRGYVEYPNVHPSREMADAVLASRAYEANVTVTSVTKTLINQSLRIIA
ncbi:MAG: flagellar basal body protein [Planctomycetes bacterium]|nr:flagellar basal body protein [Planctomycetota bacterium]